jgi:RimJ/RimL family protein N-acetyltransferase
VRRTGAVDRSLWQVPPTAGSSATVDIGGRLRNSERVQERIETERLLLRPIRIDDVDLLVELDSDPEVMRFLTGRPSARAEVETSIRANLGHRWIALDRASGEFVGWFGLVPLGDDAFELGYRLVRRWWGCGLATEGARAMIDEAFTMLGARRVAAQTMAVNQRSRRVMERCGMRNLRTFHVDFEDPLPGTEHGETEYELIIDEWHRRKP